jgi:hypothetical protein
LGEEGGAAGAAAVEQLVGELVIAHLLSAALADQRSQSHGQLVLALQTTKETKGCTR